jgi:hypothetical protein
MHTCACHASRVCTHTWIIPESFDTRVDCCRPVDDGVDPGLRLLMSDAVNLVSPRSGRSPNSDWLGSPRSTSSSPPSSAKVSPRSPRTVHGRESPRGDGGDATERGGKFWDFLLNAASPHASSPGGEGADDWESGLRSMKPFPSKRACLFSNPEP